jgi:hypothetical protein
MAYPKIFATYIMDSNLVLLGIMSQDLNTELQEWKCLALE